MKRLLEGLRSNFQEENQMDVLSINRLNYLQAVIQETLRLAPPITNGFPRQVPPEGAVVDGSFIPGGVCLTATILSIIDHLQQISC
jgi:cytochrome P450